ncbi:hypothetical protein HUT06_33740 [Actinomadura sp. NAK00032]|uniref:hypothetical protein n=1 Tax=Actinomadura sp. NAK00032 TaxID=2742128 RepID=UPI0015929E0F|nr:hypothetical protein [Actinomadura sp. NAK00032]QKW38363.1 hypothetical protein HUT06_33740 [Actinomadura sp. NAK00032]
MSQGGEGTETRHDPQRLLAAATHLDSFSDRAKKTKAFADAAKTVSGHEWGLVGAAFSVNYGQAAESACDHIDMIATFLADAEKAMTATARNYAAANEAILGKLRLLEQDLPGIRPA